MSRLSWVNAKTNARSKKSSNVVTRSPSSLGTKLLSLRVARLLLSRPVTSGSRPCGLAEVRCVLGRRGAEESSVLPAELRRTLVTDLVSGARDVTVVGEQPDPSLLEPDLLLELDGAHAGHGL